MKAGDLVRYHKEAVSSYDGETYFYETTKVAVVVEDYESWTKLIKIYCEGETKIVHISEVSTLKRGVNWTKTSND